MYDPTHNAGAICLAPENGLHKQTAPDHRARSERGLAVAPHLVGVWSAGWVAARQLDGGHDMDDERRDENEPRYPQHLRCTEERLADTLPRDAYCDRDGGRVAWAHSSASGGVFR
jgi:hypothetical protein